MIAMPEPDRGVLDRRAEIVEALRRIVPGEGVIDREHELRAFESDGLTAYRQPPMVAVLPETTAQVQEVMRYCAANKIKVVPRGAGTSLSGGALPLADGVLLGMGKFNKILEIDVANRCVVAQPGVTNLGITNAVQGLGLYYAPDPSSQIACTIGGNVAENSGGVHCLKYGLTTNNVIGVEMVTIEGEIVRLGGKHFDSESYDLLGVMVGSEGMLGIVTEVTVRILPKPPGARALLIGFSTVEGAGDCVADVIGGWNHSRRHGDHGPAGGGGGRGLRSRRLPARLRGAADRRTRRLRGRGRSPHRRGRSDRRPPWGDEPPGEPLRSGAPACSGPGERPLSRRSAGSRRTITAWTERSRAGRSAAFSSR